MNGPLFQYELPTKIEFGNGTIQKLATHVHALEGSKVLIVSDPGVVQAGIVDHVTAPLEKASIPYEIFDDIEPDPDINGVEKGTTIAQRTGCNLVVGVGGGSSLDTAKSIGLMMENEGHIRDYVGADKVPNPGSPVIAVPTTAGTGSEVTRFAVLTDKEQHVKLSVSSPYNCPDLALCDPELTVTLPSHITAATGMDALTHALESYVNKATQPISEALSLGAMKLVVRSLRLAVVQGENLQARYDMLLASLMAAMAFNATRLGISHALAIPLGAHFKIPHGTVNAILLPEVMDFNIMASPKKFADIAAIFDVGAACSSMRERAEQSVAAVRQLNEDIGIHHTLTDYGVKETDLDMIASEAMESGNIPVNPRQPTLGDLQQICRKLL